ncbi:hypothetical protein HanIR_Chr02g0072091 [Helianthus annuus]|nr:hypothetical protein HanIR_Chr02g0072091 [Helianthus annuus]
MSAEIEKWQGCSSSLDSTSLTGSCDSWAWIGDVSGDFSVVAFKKLMLNLDGLRDNYVLEWCKWILAKCNIFMWREELNWLPMKDAILKYSYRCGLMCFMRGCPSNLSITFSRVVWSLQSYGINSVRGAKSQLLLHSPLVTSWSFMKL